MKFSSAVLLTFCMAVVTTESDAFSVPSSPYKTFGLRRPTTSLASSAQDEVAALRAAAAKAREEVERLSQELGKKSPVKAATASSTLPKKSIEEVQALIPQIIRETDVSKQLAEWSSLKESKALTAFGSANLRTFPVSLQMLESRTGITAESLGLDESTVNMDDFKYATLYVAGGSAVAGIASLALLPPNIGATFCYFFALLPVLFLGIGSSAPQVIANAIASIKGADTGSSSVSQQERICRHEAAHFCCGYWCGLPVTSYSVDDVAQGVAQVEFGVASQQLSQTEVAALAVTALAGLTGEALKWNKAVGAANDLLVLEGVFRKSKEFIGAQAQQDLTRWAALTATSLLKQNNAKFEQVVEAFARKAPLEECIAILEK